MNSEQQMRAYAVQAAASFVSGMSGDMKDLLHTADTIYAWVQHGFDGVPQKDLEQPVQEAQVQQPGGLRITEHPDAQKLAEEAMQAPSRSAVEAIRQRAAAQALLDRTVSLGAKSGQLEDYLTHRWKELPRQPEYSGMRSELGL